MSRRNPKRKITPGRFAMVPRAVLHHQAVTTLNHAAFRVLVLLAGEFNGHNNGAVGLTAGQAEANGIGSKHTFYRSLRELESRGLIETTFPASRVPPRPTMYALTWLPVDQTEYSQARRVASNAYREWSARAIA